MRLRSFPLKKEGSSFDPPIQGIVLLPDEQQLLPDKTLSCIVGVDASRIDLPGSSRELQKRLEPIYSQGEWNEEMSQEIKRKIYQYYQNYEQPFVIVSIPPQRAHPHVVQIVVQESRISKIEIRGNQWVKSKQLERYVSLKPGDVISLKELNKDLEFMNRNPFRWVNLVYSPGESENTTNLTFEVKDRKPYRFYVGADNTGVSTTGRQRAFAGFYWDQVFGLDHLFFYQYTTNYDIKRFHANAFQYLAFLPNRTILNLYGGFSIVHANIPAPNMKNKGTNIQASIRYQSPFIVTTSFSHGLTFGFDLKNTNNTVEFVDYGPVFGKTVNLTQLILGYFYKWKKGGREIQGSVDLFGSPGPWLPDQTDEDFASLRPHATNKWLYANALFSWREPLPRSCSLFCSFRGQMSSQALLPSEQLGIGGYDTVRGYDPRQLNVDTGVYGTFEFHTSTISVFRGHSSNPDRLYFLLFLDGGYGIEKTPIPGVSMQNYLLGTGPGMRYSLDPYFSGWLYLGFKLHEQESFTGGSPMIHFSVSGSY